MELTLSQVAEIVEGRVHGDGGHVIRGVCGLEETGAKAADHLAFVVAKGTEAPQTEVTSVLVARVPDGGPDRNWIEVEDPYLAIARVAGRFHPLPRAEERRIHPSAVVDGAELDDPVEVGAHAVVEPGARVGAGTIVMGGAYVGAGAVVGRDCILYPNAVLYEGVVLGDRVRVHSGAVIGADGFGNARAAGRWVRMPQVGNVVLEDDVEIGAGATVDRATFGSTTIGRGTKIDNLVMIAHNSRLGEDCALAAQVGMAGTTMVGDRVQMAGQVGIAGHLTIGSDVVLGGKSAVMNDIKGPGFYVGLPAMEGQKFLTMLAEQRRVGELRKRVRRLERRMEELEK